MKSNNCIHSIIPATPVDWKSSRRRRRVRRYPLRTPQITQHSSEPSNSAEIAGPASSQCIGRDAFSPNISSPHPLIAILICHNFSSLYDANFTRRVLSFSNSNTCHVLYDNM